MRWRKSMAQSAVVFIMTFNIPFFSDLVDRFNFIEEILVQVDEWIAKIDLDFLDFLESENQETTVANSTGEQQVIETEPIYKTGNELYNSILQSLTNMEDSVDLADYTTDSDEVFDTLEQVLDDHPEIFYYDYSTSVFWTDGVLELGYKYSKSDIDRLNEELNGVAQEVFGNMSAAQSEYDKVKVIHDYLVENTAYDYDNYLEDTIPDESYTIIGTLLLGTAVCDGYTKSMQFLLNKIGIESEYVSGTGNGEAHAWNKVKINNNWYNIDSTWDDPVPDQPGSISYDYFLVTDEYLSRDHNWKQAGLPVANDTEYMEKLSTFR